FILKKCQIDTAQGGTLRAIQNNLNRYDDWLCVWRGGMWDDECSSLDPPVLAIEIYTKKLESEKVLSKKKEGYR
ncbi:hypothetical protein BpHYR1_022562, partial [Brachionus plicatilis]